MYGRVLLKYEKRAYRAFGRHSGRQNLCFFALAEDEMRGPSFSKLERDQFVLMNRMKHWRLGGQA